MFCFLFFIYFLSIRTCQQNMKSKLFELLEKKFQDFQKQFQCVQEVRLSWMFPPFIYLKLGWISDRTNQRIAGFITSSRTFFPHVSA